MNTILIADREPAHRQQIRLHIAGRPEFRVVGECGNRHETIRYVNALEPDILFLDVQLGGDRAFDLIQQTDHLPKIIYTADTELHALQAFHHQALDYLLKPCGAARLDAALQKAISPTVAGTLQQKNPTQSPYHLNFFVEDGKRLRRLAVCDICYLKAARDYTVIYSTHGEFLSASGIGSIEQRLDPSRFLRVHRSFIVNVECVHACYRDVGRFYLQLENGQEIGVGKRYVSNIKPLIL